MRGRGSSMGIGVLALLVVAACGEDVTSPAGPDASFVGSWGGEAWAGEAWVASVGSGDTIYVGGTAPRRSTSTFGGHAQSIVSVRVVYSGPGVYQIGPDQATFARLIGGDIIVSTYRTYVENAGWISITEDAEGRLAGSVSFDAQDTRAHGPGASTLRFEGVFEGGVPE